MRICYIITRADTVGGPHILVRDQCLKLMEDGHEVLVLVGQSGEGPYPPDLEKHGVPHRCLDHLIRPIRPRDDVLGYFEIRRHLKEFRPHVVTTHSSKAGWLGRLAAWSLGIPNVFTVHGWAFTPGVSPIKRVVYAMAEKLASPFCRRFITVSEYDRQLGRSWWVAPLNRMKVIHNGVPDGPEEWRARPGTDSPQLIMVARFEKQKDHLTLLQALARLKDLDWSLLLVGEGPTRPDMEKWVADNGLQSKVTFTGFCPHREVPNHLAQSHIFLLISLWEGFPCSILEAMRAGLPVVVSDVGGSGEAVRDGETGYVVDREDVDALADTLKPLLTDGDLRREMGAAGRKFYQESFTFQVMYEKTLALFQSLARIQ